MALRATDSWSIRCPDGTVIATWAPFGAPRLEPSATKICRGVMAPVTLPLPAVQATMLLSAPSQAASIDTGTWPLGEIRRWAPNWSDLADCATQTPRSVAIAASIRPPASVNSAPWVNPVSPPTSRCGRCGAPPEPTRIASTALQQSWPLPLVPARSSSCGPS